MYRLVFHRFRQYCTDYPYLHFFAGNSVQIAKKAGNGAQTSSSAFPRNPKNWQWRTDSQNAGISVQTPKNWQSGRNLVFYLLLMTVHDLKFIFHAFIDERITNCMSNPNQRPFECY